MSALYTRTFWIACVVHFAAAMSLSMFVLLPLFVRACGGSDAYTGMALGLAGAASVAMRPFVGMALDRVGVRPLLLGAGALNVLSWLPFLGVEGAGVWLVVWAVVHTVAWGALFAALFTYVADLAPASRRAEGIAVFGVFGISANGLAPVLGERIIETAGYQTFFLTAAAFGLASLALTLLVRPVRHAGTAPTVPAPREAITVAMAPGLPMVLGATMLLGVAINAAWYFVAPFTRDVGIAHTAPFFQAYAATSVVIRLIGRRALDRLGPHRLSGPAFVLFALGLAGLWLLPRPGVLVACGIGCGFGHGTLFPVLNALSVSRAPAGRQGSVVSLHTAALDLGAVLGTPVCGVIAQLAGFRAMFAAMAVVCVAGMALMAVDARRGRAAVPATA